MWRLFEALRQHFICMLHSQLHLELIAKSTSMVILMSLCASFHFDTFYLLPSLTRGNFPE